MLKKSYPYYLGNEPVAPNQDLEVTDKYTGEVATRVALADTDAIDRGIALAVEATEPMRQMAAFERQQVLQHCVERFSERADELAMALCIEAGKPIKDSRGEVSRLVDTFRIAAEESVRITGEVLPLDISPRSMELFLLYWILIILNILTFLDFRIISRLMLNNNTIK